MASPWSTRQTAPITPWLPQGKKATTRTVYGLPPDRHAHFRLVALQTPAPSAQVTVYAALDLDQVEETLADMRWLVLKGLCSSLWPG